MKKLIYFLMATFMFVAVACNTPKEETVEAVEETEVSVSIEVEEAAVEVVVE